MLFEIGFRNYRNDASLDHQITGVAGANDYRQLVSTAELISRTEAHRLRAAVIAMIAAWSSADRFPGHASLRGPTAPATLAWRFWFN